MMRKCHLNTCPVGVATQDPVLRKKFAGKPEHVVNYLFMVAEEARQIMAELGFRTIRTRWSAASIAWRRDAAIKHWKADGLDLTPLLDAGQQAARPTRGLLHEEAGPWARTLRSTTSCIDLARGSRSSSARRRAKSSTIINTNRTVGTMLSHEIAKKWGEKRCPTTRSTSSSRARPARASARSSPRASRSSSKATQRLRRQGPLGRPGHHLSAARSRRFVAEDNIIIGNVALYGATSGGAFFRGRAAERFCVRNSGAKAVIEGVGDHGCEYMTGGRVVILGPTGRNFAAGMCGGIAYVWDVHKDFAPKCNMGMVELEASRGGRGHRRAARADRAAPGVHRLDGRGDGSSTTGRSRCASSSRSCRPTTNACSPSARGTTRKSSRRSRATRPVRSWRTLADKVGRFVAWVSRPASKSIRRRACRIATPRERVRDFREIFTQPADEHLRNQGARCMDCGVPFCQSLDGCPIDNLIPEWNDLVYQGRWRDALDRLHKTNNFPEFTGRTCPAPCEGACVLGITDPPVTIKNIENAIIDRGFAEGWVEPHVPEARTGKRVAIVGCGPAGLAAAAQLNKVGHKVTVYERADRIGGLLDVRHPEHEARQAGREPARRPAACGRHRVRHERRRRQERRRGQAASRARRAAACDRRDAAARSQDPRPRAQAASISRWSS